MKLVIAEKPALATAIADAVYGAKNRGDGCIDAGDYKITWLFGHILQLKEPEDYDAGYKRWNIGQLPIYFDPWEQKPSPDGAKITRLNQIKAWLKDADCVIHAGDPDDEGQLLVDEVLRYCNYKGTVYRLDTANTTKEAMEKALNNLHPNNPKLGYAAFARSIADMTVGINMSRFFTCHNNTLLTVGRVQTPTLGLVVQRDRLIENHVKQMYYTVEGVIDIANASVPFKVELPKDDPRLDEGLLINKDEAVTIQKKLDSATLNPVSISKKQEKDQPPLPFNLVKLQTACGAKYGYTPSQVMDITQSLRDNHSAITYNRSDCQYLSTDHWKEAPSTVAQVLQNTGWPNIGYDTTLKSKAFNDANITAHFAIIPTNKAVSVASFTTEERNVYELIAQYYLAQFLQPAVKEITSLKSSVPNDKASVTASSTKIASEGYRVLFSNLKTETTVLSDIPAGTYSGTVTDTKIVERETKPPSRYTQTSLNLDMTRISKYVQDERIKKLLLEKDKEKKGENGSIGTVATRSAIIENLIKRGFLMEKGKQLISTPVGRELYDILPDELKKPDMTAEWWVIQERIKDGADYHELTDDVLNTCKHILSQTYPKLKSAPSSKPVLGKCPRCGGDIVEGKVGFGCSNWKSGCKFVIWKKSKSSLFSKVTISASMAKTLLAGKPVTSKKLYSKNKDKTFEGSFKLADKGSEYGADYELLPFDNSKTTTRSKKTYNKSKTRK